MKKATTILVLLALSGCSLIGGGRSDPPSPPSAPSGMGGAIESATQTAKEWWWMSLILVLFFPTVREPVARLWAAVFSALAIPFISLRSWWDTRWGSGTEEDSTPKGLPDE